MDQRFLDFGKRMDQGFAHAEKARQQNFIRLNQRFDDMNRGVNQDFGGMNQRFDGMPAEIRSLRNTVYALTFTVIAATLVAAVKLTFFS